MKTFAFMIAAGKAPRAAKTSAAGAATAPAAKFAVTKAGKPVAWK